MRILTHKGDGEQEVHAKPLSNCVKSQVQIGFGLTCQARLFLMMAFRVISNFRAQAIRATFLSFPVEQSFW